MNEKPTKDELRTETGHGHFSRAAFLAASLGLPEQELEDLRVKALWQMAAVHRNSPGTKLLAQEYGYSKGELRDLLERLAKQGASAGDAKSLEPCYDLSAGTHLSFEEWMYHFLKRWDKLPVS